MHNEGGDMYVVPPGDSDIQCLTSETLPNRKLFSWMAVNISCSHPELRGSVRAWAVVEALDELHLTKYSCYLSSIMEMHIRSCLHVPASFMALFSSIMCLSLSIYPCSSCESWKMTFSFLSFCTPFSIWAVTLLKKITVQNQCCKHPIWHKILPEIPFV